jgi:hypothetical protein
MTGAGAAEALLARFIALDDAARSSRQSLFERTELLRRAALILTLAPGSGDQSASEESAEALVSRWRDIARSLRGRSDWRAPLASTGRCNTPRRSRMRESRS